MIKPKALKKGDTVGLIAPSGPVEGAESVERAIKYINELGYNVKPGAYCRGKYGYLAGNDEERARDINDMFADPEVDAVICLLGGYGTPRILDRIDYRAISGNPKLLVGYSDITGLHLAINKICGLVTIHGPMPVSDSECYGGDDMFSRKALLKTVSSANPVGLIKNPEGEQIRRLTGGKAKGILTGGNLSLIAAAMGTDYEIDTAGKILFLEDVGEEPYRVDRMLTQLRLAGKFKECSGIVLGSWSGCEPEEPHRSLSLENVFEDIVAECGKPAICNLRAGHCSPKVTLPLGVEAVLDADNCTLEITESAVV